jgi:hypothetical protein
MSEKERPTPRPRVAGSRRSRADDAPSPRARRSVAVPAEGRVPAAEPAERRGLLLPLSLLLLVALAAAAVAVLLWQRVSPPYVDARVFAATQDNVEALYAYDYREPQDSVEGKLDALTGELREQYETDLSQGGILEAYEQVSATTRYEVLDIGLQQINDAQDTATLVVFGSYVVESVNSGRQPAPEGSECQVTPEGAQSCTQTVRVGMVQVDGDWKISELTLLTTS